MTPLVVVAEGAARATDPDWFGPLPALPGWRGSQAITPPAPATAFW